jgi:hypothetical protein
MTTRTLQDSHDAMAQQLAVLLGQVVYGHHGITRLQVLMAAEELKKAIPFTAQRTVDERMGLVPPSIGWVDTLITKASEKR